MPYQAQWDDVNEPFHDTDAEIMANMALYNVISGCAITYSGANLNVTIAAGTVTHNGNTVTAAGGTVALIANATNPTWALGYVDSTGAVGIVHGTPAAAPGKPELGDNVIIFAARIDANLTIASSAAVRLDKRIPALPTLTMPSVITPFSAQSIGGILAARGTAVQASNTYPTANRAFYIPFVVTQTITIDRMFIVNGAAVSGNFDIGVYSEGGTKQITTASTAQAGTSRAQDVNVTNTTLNPGRYYLAIAMDNTTGTTLSSGNVVDFAQLGVYIQDTAFPLPATAAFATGISLNSNVPIFGFTIETLT